MKRILRILVLALTLVTGLTSASAQTVQVQLFPKTPNLPTTITNYLEDPLRYFDIYFVAFGAGMEGLDVFFDMTLTSPSGSVLVRTKPETIPFIPMHLSEGSNFMRSDEFEPQLLNRLEPGASLVDYNNPLKVIQLSEGTYELCVDVYLWSERMNPDRVPISIPPCPSFEICYSGSAPELVSPLAGSQLALNGTMVVTPNRKVNFFWTPVISNCAGKNAKFNYKLKVVKVLDNQNYQDAIKFNPTVFSTEVRNLNYAVFDTLRDVKVQMERGALYVAQVQAEKINTRDYEEPFIIANDGNSQPMPFFWGGDITSLDLSHLYSMDDESEEGEELEGIDGRTQWEGGVEEVSELETIVDEMKPQYLASFIQDDATVSSLVAAYPSELQYVPTPKRRYVSSDGYYTVPMADDFEVSFMPTRHDLLKDVSYTIELYDYIDGGVDSITAYEPLFSEQIEEVPESYSKMDSHDLISRTLEGWGTDLVEGSLYYLQLTSTFTVGYSNYSISDTNYYVNQKLAEHIHDTISRDYEENELMFSNGVFFQWGEDPEVPGITTPQWKAPVDRTGDDIYDPVNYVLPTLVPEVQKAKTFPVSWTSVKDVPEGDTVIYEVNVYELKSGQTLDEAVLMNDVLVTRTVVNDTEISSSDTKFFKVFSSNKTYVMTLATIVESEDNLYHFENGNQALPIVIKIVR